MATNGKLKKPDFTLNQDIHTVISNISVGDNPPGDNTDRVVSDNTLNVNIAIANMLYQKSRSQYSRKEQVTSVCADCEEPISKKRLEAIPLAIRCRNCQEAYEKKLEEQGFN